MARVEIYSKSTCGFCYRAKQLLRWIHQRGVDDFEAMSDVSKALRDRLAASAGIIAPPVRRATVAADGTRNKRPNPSRPSTRE